MELVTSKEEIAANLAVFDSYRLSENPSHRAYFGKRFRLGKQFVYAKIDKRYIFAPSRFAGYSKCTLERHVAFPGKDGKLTTPSINHVLGKPASSAVAEAAYIALCNEVGVEPSGKERTYWELDVAIDTHSVRLAGGEPGYPDDVAQYIEGATKRIFINAYERNAKAREACLAACRA